MTQQVKFRGVAVEMGGREWVLPPLNFRQLQEYGDRLQHLTGGGRGSPLSRDQQETVVDVVLSTLQRNYPEVSREEVLDMLDLGNVHLVITALAGQSGLEVREPGEPVAQESPSTGSSSTASSSPSTTGPGNT